ncbi:hypothetical protein ACWECW_19705 [Rhodococcus ruber]
MRRILAAMIGTASAALIAVGTAGAAHAAPIVDPSAVPPFVKDTMPSYLFTLSPEELAELNKPDFCPPGNTFLVVNGTCTVLS